MDVSATDMFCLNTTTEQLYQNNLNSMMKWLIMVWKLGWHSTATTISNFDNFTFGKLIKPIHALSILYSSGSLYCGLSTNFILYSLYLPPMREKYFMIWNYLHIQHLNHNWYLNEHDVLNIFTSLSLFFKKVRQFLVNNFFSVGSCHPNLIAMLSVAQAIDYSAL